MDLEYRKAITKKMEIDIGKSKQQNRQIIKRW